MCCVSPILRIGWLPIASPGCVTIFEDLAADRRAHAREIEPRFRDFQRRARALHARRQLAAHAPGFGLAQRRVRGVHLDRVVLVQLRQDGLVARDELFGLFLGGDRRVVLALEDGVAGAQLLGAREIAAKAIQLRLRAAQLRFLRLNLQRQALCSACRTCAFASSTAAAPASTSAFCWRVASPRTLAA